MLLIIVWLLPRVLSEMSLHHVYISRKSRSNVEPIQTRYVFNRVNDYPGTDFDSAIMEKQIDSDSTNPFMETYTNDYKYVPPTVQYLLPVDSTKQIIKTSRDSMPSRPKKELETIAKSESKYSVGFLPSKIKTDAMYNKLKSAMHYHPPDVESLYGYETEYHIDDDDVRSSSRGVPDSWPYYYHNPHEYDHIRIDAERQKAEDKRYSPDLVTKIIPIHEDLSDDIPNLQEQSFNSDYKDMSPDNPMSGHDPFFSFILNDDFHKKNDYDDELTFKELDWAKDFDSHMFITDLDDFSRKRRLPISNISGINSKSGSNVNLNNNNIKTAEGDSTTENSYIQKQVFEKHEKGAAENANDAIQYEQNGNQHIGFKDFVDTFANKFGSENHKKDSKFALKRNQDKGENRKGFRRVYHKDEYQEDNEFYDNNNNSVKSEDTGSSNVNIGGSEAFLKSNASAKLGNQSSAIHKMGDMANKRFEKKHGGYDNRQGSNSQINRYRDAAKNAALSNDADYSEQFRI